MRLQTEQKVAPAGRFLATGAIIRQIPGIVVLISLLPALLLGGCSGKPAKPVVQVSKPAEVLDRPVLAPEDETTWRTALSLLDRGQIAQARAAFNGLLLRQPRLAGAYVNLAILDELENNLPAAEAHYLKALSLNPANQTALINLALIRQQQGRFREAEVELLKAEAVNGNHPLVHYNLGVLYELYLQDPDRAIKHYRRYVGLGEVPDRQLVERWISLLERKS
jgi:Flp pilus assembly protein TadD